VSETFWGYFVLFRAFFEFHFNPYHEEPYLNIRLKLIVAKKLMFSDDYVKISIIS
jgi:hypothetical protein